MPPTFPAALLGILLVAAHGAAVPDAAAGWRVETLAGGGVADGRPARSVSLRPLDVLVDRANGDLYVADADSARIRKVDATTRTIATIAGNGRAGTYLGAGARPAFCGDGGPATEACLALQHFRVFFAFARLARAASGDLYVTDAGNHRLRRVAAATGRISTVTGNEQLDGEGGCLMSRDGRRRRSSECLGVPGGVVVSGTKLFVAEAGQVLQVNPRSGSTRVVAGRVGECATPSVGGEDPLIACLPGPLALASAGNGALIVSSPNGGVFRFDPAAGTLEKIMGGAIGCSGALPDGQSARDACAAVADVAADADGNVYFATYGRIYRIDAATQTVVHVAGNGFIDPSAEEGIFCGDGGPAVDACLNDVRALDVDAAGNIFLADTGNRRVRRVDAVTREITTYAGGDFCDCDVAADASESCVAPAGIALAPGGRLLVTNRDRICRVDLGSRAMGVVVGGPGHAVDAHAIATDAAGNAYVAEPFLSRVRRMDAVTRELAVVAGDGHDGSTEPCFANGEPAISTCLGRPEGVAIAPDGALWIADTGHDRVRRVDFATTQLLETIALVSAPVDVAFEPSGTLLATERQERVVRIDPATGAVTPLAGRPLFTPPFPNSPFGIDGPAVDARLGAPLGTAGDTAGNVYIADPFFHGLLRIDADSGVLRALADLPTVRDVVVDADDRVLLADAARVRRLAPSTALAVQRLDYAPADAGPSAPAVVRFEATLRDPAIADPAAFLRDGVVLGVTDTARAPLVLGDFFGGAWLTAAIAPSECRLSRSRLACRRNGRAPVTLRVETLADGTGLRLRGTLAGPRYASTTGLAIVLDHERLVYHATLAP